MQREKESQMEKMTEEKTENVIVLGGMEFVGSEWSNVHCGRRFFRRDRWEKGRQNQFFDFLENDVGERIFWAKKVEKSGIEIVDEEIFIRRNKLEAFQ